MSHSITKAPSNELVWSLQNQTIRNVRQLPHSFSYLFFSAKTDCQKSKIFDKTTNKCLFLFLHCRTEWVKSRIVCPENQIFSLTMKQEKESLSFQSATCLKEEVKFQYFVHQITFFVVYDRLSNETEKTQMLQYPRCGWRNEWVRELRQCLWMYVTLTEAVCLFPCTAVAAAMAMACGAIPFHAASTCREVWFLQCVSAFDGNVSEDIPHRHKLHMLWFFRRQFCAKMSSSPVSVHFLKLVRSIFGHVGSRAQL